MNTNISGPAKEPLSRTPPPESSTMSTPAGGTAPSSSSVPPAAEVMSTNFQAKETDTIDQQNVVIQLFVNAKESAYKEAYLSSAEMPTLPPPDLEGNSGPQPFEPSWKKAVDRFFKERIKENLAEKMKGKGNVDAHFSRIIQSLSSGKFKMLSSEDLQIIEKSTNETKKAWNLPASWKIDSPKAKDWTPLSLETETPINIEASRREILAGNAEELLESLEKIGNKVSASFPANDPNYKATGDFIQVIGQAIRELKNVLRNLQLEDTELSKKFSLAKLEETKERTKELEGIVKKNEEIMANRAKQEKSSFIWKILGPALSALALVAAIAAIPLTGGASAVLIAGVIVSATMLVYSSLDSAFELTSKAVSGLGQLLEKAFPGDENAAIRKAIKIVFAVALVIVIVVAIATTGNASLGNLASQVVAKEVAKMVVKQIAIQASVMLLMSSNVIPELCTDMLIKTGVIDLNDEKAKMIAQILLTALTMLILLGGMALGARALSGPKTAVPAAQQAAGLQSSINKVSDALKSALDWIKKLPKDLAAGFKTFVTLQKDDTVLNFFLRNAPDALRITNIGVEAGFGVYVGLLGLTLAQMYKDMGELEKAQELMQLLIKLFGQILNTIQEGLGTRSEWLNSLQNALNSVYAAGSQMSTRVAQARA